jgi:hypothetical protein
VSTSRPAARLTLRALRTRLAVNGAEKQRSNLSHHIWSVPETVRFAVVDGRGAACG